ncbi:hypothetical protein cyc_00287 [Cyclospora cayetanensis]|uniref:Uncharacterized protein n=1 Tax=Cyclospora cayetanensis TaxID=88456 RepID=A0A1D3D0B9_9EIME|nr:hypothetical protein cyc_00287 [Cyclospora cayetanensis]
MHSEAPKTAEALPGNSGGHLQASRRQALRGRQDEEKADREIRGINKARPSQQSSRGSSCTNLQVTDCVCTRQE